jgi:hypothetical protein
MSDMSLRALLGHDGSDPGCEGAFELFDEYCDVVLRGALPGSRFAGLLSHIANCSACREDTEALLAALRDQKDDDAGDAG